MKKLAIILTSFALAVGLMIPTVAFANDGYANITIDYNGERIRLLPQVDNDANSVKITFDVQTDVEKYQRYVQVGFTLSDDARQARVAQADVSGSNVTAVVSNGESPLKFVDNNFFLGTLTVNVAAKLVDDDSTDANLVVTSLDSTDATFGSPTMHTMTTRDENGELSDISSRSVPFTIAASAYTGDNPPDVAAPPSPQPPTFEKSPTDVGVLLGGLGDGATISTGAKTTLQNIGSELLQKVKDDLEAMLAGNGSLTGLTPEQLKLIAEVIEEAGGDLDQVDVALTPYALKLEPDDVKDDIDALNKKIPGAKLLSVYDLGVYFSARCNDKYTGDIPMSELPHPIEFSLSVPEGSLSTMDAAVGFMHEGVAETINSGVTPSVKESTVQFPAQKFSTYAVYGKTKSPIRNGAGLAGTGDSRMALMLGLGAIVLIASVIVVFTGRSRAAKKGTK